MPLAECLTLRHLGLAYRSLALASISQITSLDLTTRVDRYDITRLLSPDLRLIQFTAKYLFGQEDLDWLTTAPQLANLESLSLPQLADISSIAKVNRWADTMRVLAVHAPQLSDVAPLRELALLEDVNLIGTPIASLEFTRDLPALRVLHIGGTNNELPDLRSLLNHPTLKHLKIQNDMAISVDLSGLAGASDLEVQVKGGHNRNVLGLNKLPPSVKVTQTP
jgi:hypothetical protein